MNRSQQVATSAIAKILSTMSVEEAGELLISFVKPAVQRHRPAVARILADVLDAYGLVVVIVDGNGIHVDSCHRNDAETKVADVIDHVREGITVAVNHFTGKPPDATGLESAVVS